MTTFFGALCMLLDDMNLASWMTLPACSFQRDDTKGLIDCFVRSERATCRGSSHRPITTSRSARPLIRLLMTPSLLEKTTSLASPISTYPLEQP